MKKETSKERALSEEKPRGRKSTDTPRDDPRLILASFIFYSERREKGIPVIAELSFIKVFPEDELPREAEKKFPQL